MAEADRVPQFMESYALDIPDRVSVSTELKRAAIRIPLLRGVKQNVGLHHRGTGITIISHRERIGTKA